MKDLNTKILEVGTCGATRESWIQWLRQDEKYIQACKEVDGAENLYEALELTVTQREIVDDYIRSVVVAMGRANDVCYLSGIKDALSLEPPETNQNQDLKKSIQLYYMALKNT